MRKICQAVLPLRVEQERSENVSLKLRPEHRKQRWCGTSHSLKLSTVYPKCQVGGPQGTVLLAVPSCGASPDPPRRRPVEPP